MQQLQGNILGHYEILGSLGAGGMGEVYRARDTTLKREVALKVLPEHVAKNPDSLSRFEREAVVLAQLSHPNILAIHDFGQFDGVAVAVMELLHGETLRSKLEKNSIPARRSLEISAEVAAGLAAAHSKGIIHRDLKPENIFITRENQIKILDFGLARIDSAARDDSGDRNVLPTETEPGLIKGTIGYMAPEQLRGEGVDARSDIFSLGCVLYEMLTGRRAFAKTTVAETMTAILKEEPPDFAESGRQIPPDAERVTSHCLEKDPTQRFQSANDLALHLRTIASTPDLVLPYRARWKKGRFRSLWLPAATLLVLLAALVLLWLRLGPSGSSDTPRPSVAVLYFENNTGDPSLDWLRTALTNMLVTDLSQSPEIEVLGTDRLYEVLKDLGQLDEPALSHEAVRALAQRAGVKTVLWGSFVKAGETFRLNTRLQEAQDGRILATERVEGVGESSLFQMVDELTLRVKQTLEVSGPNGMLDRGIESVTSSSVTAYRHYVEANEFHIRSMENQAIEHLERAIELDPNFAMAYAKLSVAHWNLGHVDLSHEYARGALQDVDRLTDRERYYIEGRYYSMNPSTYDKAIRAYETAIGLYPDHSAARNNLANLYSGMERFDDAISQYEALRKAQSPFAGTYANLATAYASVGDADKGYEVLRQYVEKHSDSAVGHRNLGGYLIELGRLDQAFEELRAASLLAPGDLPTKSLKWMIHVLREDWEAARQIADEIALSDDPHWKSEALSLQATLDLLRGQREMATQHLEEAQSLFPERSAARATLLLRLGQVALLNGDSGNALEKAQTAFEAGREFPVETDILALAALAHSQMGNSAEAVANFEELRQRYSTSPARLIRRYDNFILGQMALLEGNSREAVSRFEEAWETFSFGIDIPGAGHFFETGLAYWESDQKGQAVDWFQRLLNSSSQRVFNPIGYVRSLYYLGEYHLERGDSKKANGYFSHFAELWDKGDMDRDKVEKARASLKN